MKHLFSGNLCRYINCTAPLIGHRNAYHQIRYEEYWEG